MAWKIGLTCGHASGSPPGMIDGPFKAPSSPPETPVPIKSSPLAFRSRVRRVESGKCELPPSIRMSPGLKQRDQLVDHVVDRRRRP